MLIGEVMELTPNVSAAHNMATRLADEICPDRTDCRCAEAKGIQCVLRPARENSSGSAVPGLGRKYANLG